ncbi:NADH-quinone oxidoreductase subunit I [Corallococcus exiguus]|uniref:NuoI/complex I 23 kDa subunit family protein n=1 Tax=Corallococcus TaxID=83461 RepID=UPI000EA312E2|nr:MULTISPECIES: NADH-quinone oxidoreductase subunit I [Corallococcus]RKI46351.1 NADH-quinone oxidoreductase subunit I [Corallococcus sp. AB004]NNB90336.1 NADH-quinone oxidoreductase subunit I [Corallococcus exiguus]NNB95632.1 NADH-quinone oxidoreductase subunit I [Corallococcus exiguus]NNC07041.1 NADH-quinone oxidoreductase subunit I [Corallococcus exiguus]NPC50883.1 NADH-quinone oxidoreductase subunit I [Corallococcus exiguus]
MAFNASQDPRTDLRERMYIPELLRGLAITTKHFFRNMFGTRDPNPQVVDRTGMNLMTTVEYPEEKPIYPEGYRGLHRLVPRDDGKPRCVACYMCATICPAQCIYIEAGEYETASSDSESAVIEKYPTQFVIDELRCIVCGLCVEACPKDAIRMDTYMHTPSEYNRQNFVYDIPKLLKGPPVSHPSDPWNKRDSSSEPHHVHKEAHTRVGEGHADHGHGHAKQLGAGHGHAKASTGHAVVTQQGPIQVTKFIK